MTFAKIGYGQDGHTIFLDASIPPSADWVAEIENQLRRADLFIVILTEGASKSEMVQSEVRTAFRYAKDRGRPTILPIRARFSEPLGYELESYLGRLQYSRWDGPQDLPRIIEEIRSIAAGTETSPASAHPPSAPLSPPPEERPKDGSLHRPSPSADLSILSPPGGTLRLDDPFYIQRTADNIISQRALVPGRTTVIQGPRQVGKSSLLLRYLQSCGDLGRRIAFLDFQYLGEETLATYPGLLAFLFSDIARQLRVPLREQPATLSHASFTVRMEEDILHRVEAPVTLSLDESDRVLGKSYQQEFFGILRLWHNKRAEPESPWHRVDLALSISTEPHLLIDSASQSPFNVTPPIVLFGFTSEEVSHLNELHGHPLTPSQLEVLLGLLGGQPYLTRLAFYRIVGPESYSFDELMEKADDWEGPFSDHLRALLFKLSTNADLLTSFQRLLRRGTPCPPDYSHRLQAAGLLRHRNGTHDVANQLYARFFGRV